MLKPYTLVRWQVDRWVTVGTFRTREGARREGNACKDLDIYNYGAAETYGIFMQGDDWTKAPIRVQPRKNEK